MEDVRGVFRDVFNMYKEHEEKTDWNKWSNDILQLAKKHKDSILCAEMIFALNRHMERRENDK